MKHTVRVCLAFIVLLFSAGASAQKIVDLPTLGAAPATNDLLIVRDTSASSTKSMTVANLFASPTLTGTVTIPAGSAGTPSLVMAGQPTLGWSNSGIGGDRWYFNYGGSPYIAMGGQFLGLGSTTTLCWTSGADPTGACDGSLTRTSSGLIRFANTYNGGAPGGWVVNADNSGAEVQLSGAYEQLTLSTGGATTNTSANLACANSQVRSIMGRVTTSITGSGVTSISIKITGGNNFKVISGGSGTNMTGLSAGSTFVAFPNAFGDGDNATATTLTVTANGGTPSGGVVRLTTVCESFSPPTS